MDSSEENKNLHTIAFYNVENLFDTVIDDFANDNDFSMTSVKKWSRKRYERKVYKLAAAISQIGMEETNRTPTIIGLAEVENLKVLEDLVASKQFEGIHYDIAHFDSPDERGIDVGLIYNADEFSLHDATTHPIYLENEEGLQDFTRDILVVSGLLGSEKIYFIVNHWPSRREGLDLSTNKRMIAAEKVSSIIERLRLLENDPKIIVMGDFNDNPNNESIQYLIKKTQLFNPMFNLLSFTRGSLNHDFKWHLFDQIMLSKNFLATEEISLRYVKADIFDRQFLTQYNGKFKGHPFRTYIGKKYKGGYSDHFPVYVQIKRPFAR